MNIHEHVEFLRQLQRGETVQAVWRLVPPVVKECASCCSTTKVVKVTNHLGERGITYRCEECLMRDLKEDIDSNFGDDSDLVRDMIHIYWFLRPDECRREYNREPSCRLKRLAPMLLFSKCFLDRNIPHVLYGSKSLVHYLTAYVTRCEG